MLFTLAPVAVEEGYGEAILPLAAAKAWLRVLHDDDDDLIAALRDAAIDMVEQYCNLRMGPVTGIVASFERFGDVMRLGVGPAHSVAVTGIGYVDATGADIVLDAGDWRTGVDGRVLAARGARWPVAGGTVTVTFDAGYANVALQAPGLVQAVRFFIAHLYINREAVMSSAIGGEVPLGFKALCDRYRVPVI